MAPYIKYGSYQHGQGECALAISKDAIYSESNVRRGWIERWDLTGRLQPATETQAGVTAAIAALENGYSINGYDLGLYLDTGVLTQHFIDSSATVGGTRVTRPPSYPTGEGAEYNVYRNYSITVEAEIPDTSSSTLLHWREAISWQGTGGAEWGYLVPLTGPPLPQQFTQASLVRMTQQGYAVGNGGYPTAADPIWPQAEQVTQRRIMYELPGRNTNERQVNWSFSFLAPMQLAGLPTVR